MGLVALPVAASVDQDKAVFRLQCRNVASLIPNVAAVGKAMSEDERWPIAFDPVVDRNALGLAHAAFLGFGGHPFSLILASAVIPASQPL